MTNRSTREDRTRTWVILAEALVEVSQLIRSDVTLWVIRRLEIQDIFTIPVELRGSHTHANHHLCVSCFADDL
jgi:hypothetical protein